MSTITNEPTTKQVEQRINELHNKEQFLLDCAYIATPPEARAAFCRAHPLYCPTEESLDLKDLSNKGQRKFQTMTDVALTELKPPCGACGAYPSACEWDPYACMCPAVPLPPPAAAPMEARMVSVEETLKEQSPTHGEWEQAARIAKLEAGWTKLEARIAELEARIAELVARIPRN